jgi:SAM-dependent methyltransferase
MDGDTQTLSTETLKCEACGAGNAGGVLFCARCTAPMGVSGLHELDEEDLSVCRSALMRVLAEETAPGPARRGVEDEALWRAYLSAFWLRPETALILYAEAMAVRGLGREEAGPWVDLGCGDGVHAALMGGWEFGREFDAFQSLDLGARDIYHHWDPSRFAVQVARKGGVVDHGFDIKPTAVARAKALGVFSDVRCADACRLPVGDGSAGTIFSNMLRDLGQPLPAALRECRRVLREDGRLLLSAMTPEYVRSLYFVNAARDAEEAGDREMAARLLRLDRGRSVFCQRQLTTEQWRDLLGEAGLKLVDAIPIVSPGVIRFWDIGLRPFSTALLRQREQWAHSGTLEEVKGPVVDLIAAQLAPLVAKLNEGPVHCMNMFVAGKA